MILLGVAFLLRTTGTFDFPLNNWWALFILIPAIGAFDTALRIYRNSNNQLTGRSAHSSLGWCSCLSLRHSCLTSTGTSSDLSS